MLAAFHMQQLYFRCQSVHGTSVQLLAAKSRIAPLRSITIPRLELLSCCIGARLLKFVKESLNIVNMKTQFWTDSTTALQWIRRDETWSVFVRNRVNEIRKLSNIDDWRHVPGPLNPADLPSRGCSVLKLLNSKWWEGSKWLLLREDLWSESNHHVNEEIVFVEKCGKSISFVNNSPVTASLFSRFSSYAKIFKILGWISRFQHNSKTEKECRKEGCLTASEINEAEKRIIKMIQEESFTEESVRGFKTLNLFRDEESILRIKTKLTEKGDLRNFRYPILLSGKHRLVELLVRKAHRENSHAGVQILLSKLLENFWIINGRRTVRREINKCLRCKRYNSRNIETQLIGLPQDRVEESAAFEMSGVHLAGPLTLKGGGKCWIVLFTCAVYRAIHPERTLSLDTRSFLLCLRLFIARLGRP
ncbi:uncharacterized protein LOC129959815 [Argiope bruennichi]|uniref:uncharacterized protein LOC129959815 n=1 Tax=Argiope bruennichi TaxID=94029 RepID=UPI0024955BF0|nr:uncharacterized protein LOC129959815 [Argiope bruennichi]